MESANQNPMEDLESAEAWYLLEMFAEEVGSVMSNSW